MLILDSENTDPTCLRNWIVFIQGFIYFDPAVQYLKEAFFPENNLQLDAKRNEIW